MKLPKLPKLRDSLFAKWHPMTWCYITVLSSTLALWETTTNPVLFFFLMLATVLVTHQSAYISGKRAAYDDVQRKFDEANGALEAVIKDFHLRFNVTIDKKEHPDNVVNLH